jgi:hypothetical protein
MEKVHVKQIRTLILGGMFLSSVTGLSYALDVYGTGLPLRNSLKTSALHAYMILKSMGGESLSQRGDPSFIMEWDNPSQTVTITSSKYGILAIACATHADAPAAKELCDEVQRRYLLENLPSTLE